MAIYYVSPYGDDTNTGATKHPTVAGGAGPWRTVKKALETGALAAGDTVYIAPGDYGGTITVIYSGANGNVISILGDPRNEQGFTTDGTTLIKPGICMLIPGTSRFSSFTATSRLVNLAGYAYITFKNLFFNFAVYSTSYTTFESSIGDSVGITLDNCCFFGGRNAISITSTAAAPTMNWEIKNCIVHACASGININPTLPTADGSVDMGIIISNCRVYGGTVAITISQSNSTTKGNGGVTVNNCTLYGAIALSTQTNTYVGTYKLTANNCVMWPTGTNSVISAAATGQIVTNNCYYQGALANHTKSMNDVSLSGASIAADLFITPELGQTQLWGLNIKPFLTPLGLPGTGACNTNPASLTTDLLNRPRPAGGGVKPYVGTVADTTKGTGAYTTGTVSSATATTLTIGSATWTTDAYIGKKVKILTSAASPTLVGAVRWISSNTSTTLTVTPSFDYTNVGAAGYPQANDTFEIYDPAKDIAVGCFELHDTGEKSTTVKDSDSYSMKLKGPGDQEIKIPVLAGYTVITVKGYYDSGYTGSLPKAELLVNASVGLGNSLTSNIYLTRTMTAAANTWETLTFNIYPTANGYITLRLTNQSTTGTGNVYFDSLNIS
jgi:hypothetical protein